MMVEFAYRVVQVVPELIIEEYISNTVSRAVGALVVLITTTIAGFVGIAVLGRVYGATYLHPIQDNILQTAGTVIPLIIALSLGLLLAALAISEYAASQHPNSIPLEDRHAPFE